MSTVAALSAFLDTFAPPGLAEGWDNVGLLLGDAQATASKVMTCLTLSPDVAQEAIDAEVGLVVTHHPILFRPVSRITSATTEGAMLLSLARAGVAVYSPHTAFDSTPNGVNDRLARKLGLHDVKPLRPKLDPDTIDALPIGSGRFGRLSTAIAFEEFVKRIRTAFDLPSLDAVPLNRPVQQVAVACGSAAEFMNDAIAAGCEVLVTGEARFHAAIEARTRDIGLVLLGHYTSERFAVEELATVIGDRFPDVTAWASRVERDPLVHFA